LVAASDEREAHRASLRPSPSPQAPPWEEGVGAEKEEAAVLEAAEQVRASQQLTDEQLGQLVRKTRSRTKAARTHQLVQAQAQHATAAARRASAMRTVTATAIAMATRG